VETNPEINPKVAEALLSEADVEISLKQEGRKYAYQVKIGPYVVAAGVKKSKADALDEAAAAAERSMEYLRSKVRGV
jgi:hypothetical protein